MATEAAKMARRAYYRQWRQKNPESVAASQERYWNKKGEQIGQAGPEPRQKGKKMDVRKLKDELIEIDNEYATAYAIACANSRDTYLKGLPAGSVVPGGKDLITEEDRAAFDETARDLKARALAAIESTMNEIAALKAAAPSADAVNVISLMGVRANVTVDDLAPVFAAYGDNYQAYAALADIAAKNDVHGIDAHPLDVLADELDSLTGFYERMSAIDARRHATPGVVAMQNAMIEANIPE